MIFIVFGIMVHLMAKNRARDRNSGARCAPADRTDRFTPTGPLFSGRSLRSNVRDFQYNEWYVDPVLKQLSDKHAAITKQK